MLVRLLNTNELKGDLVIVLGGGDPTLGSAIFQGLQFKSMQGFCKVCGFKKLKAAGIHIILKVILF
jgi:hypothetical protein